MVDIRVKLTTSKQGSFENEGDLYREIAKQFNLRLPKAIPAIRKRFQNVIRIMYFNSPEYNSLRGGKLAGDFGFLRGSEDSILDEILRVLIDEIEVGFNPIVSFGDGFRGGLFMKAIDLDFHNALASPAASYTTPKGDQIDWLAWLLLQGKTPIINNYIIVRGSFKPTHSRSQQAIMIPSTGRNYSVLSEFSGTATRNWLTRMISLNFAQIFELTNNILRDELSKV